MSPISSIVPTTNLNFIAAVGATPTASEVETGVIAANPTYSAGKATWNTPAPTATDATGTGVESQGYTGTVGVSYKIAQQLSTNITNSNLGSITTGSPTTPPSVAQLETAITLVNSGYIAGNATFGSSITPTSATATGVLSKGFVGTVNLTYVSNVDISGITIVTPPTTVSAPTPSAVTEAQLRTALDPQVLAAVQAVNSSLVANDFDYTFSAPTFPVDMTTVVTATIKITGKNQATGTTGNIDIVLPMAS